MASVVSLLLALLFYATSTLTHVACWIRGTWRCERLDHKSCSD
jgi:hypothetical protein